MPASTDDRPRAPKLLPFIWEKLGRVVFNIFMAVAWWDVIGKRLTDMVAIDLLTLFVAPVALVTLVIDYQRWER